MAWGAKQRRRIGVMGGTFDPVHHGHLVAASEVRDAFNLDEVIFVPTGEQPFKQGNDVTAAEHRYLMTVIATASNPRFTVSRMEIDRPGTTYTIDTLRDLRRELPDAELFFITGADVLPQILTWKDADELWSLAHFIGVTRPGHDLDMTGLPAAGVSLMEVTAMAISSTECRARVRAGKPVWYLVPDGVVQYIAKYGLYLPEDGEAGVGRLTMDRDVAATRADVPPRIVEAAK
ncbi:nicotinate-nucleotide adenylyltransferase [Georgenia thermotolerans]|uniref:Probable nicotinate-nucleotide adenylyltransferase n=1 Tax=Georgenia thermotolerans TaxID=527326 RepID=A0A7J5UML1_9MICO|nr:nicotinate-nucleotide adenylyltransferase [Georgenia thermotolerans]KAE8763592.1 nicotinate-nucleotide adenylyltransferase [Georgenia thermotolerans]